MLLSKVDVASAEIICRGRMITMLTEENKKGGKEKISIPLPTLDKAAGQGFEPWTY